MRDFPKEVASLKAQHEAGIENITVKAGVLFQIARTSEVALRDFKQAEHYYRLVATECSFDKRAYFARLRADELARGKIESDYAPPLPPKEGE